MHNAREGDQDGQHQAGGGRDEGSRGLWAMKNKLHDQQKNEGPYRQPQLTEAEYQPEKRPNHHQRNFRLPHQIRDRQ